MKIRDIIRSNASPAGRIGSHQSIRAAAVEMRDMDVAALVVTECDAIRGIISERDIVCAVAAHGTAAIAMTLRDAVTGRIVTADIGDTAKRAIDLMMRNRQRHLLVIDNGAIAGLLGIGDLFRHRIFDFKATVAAR